MNDSESDDREEMKSNSSNEREKTKTEIKVENEQQLAVLKRPGSAPKQCSKRSKKSDPEVAPIGSPSETKPVVRVV